MAKAVIFDMDGTLVSSFASHLRAYQDALEPYGVPFSEEFFRSVMGAKPIDNVKGRFEAAGKELPDDPQKIVDEKNRLVKETYYGDVEVLPGVSKLVSSLAADDIPLAVASGASKSVVEKIISEKVGSQNFAAIVSSDDVRHAKPDPDIFLLAARRLGVEPADCLVVEDGSYGVLAAKAAGMTVAGVLTGSGTREELEEAGADFILENLNDLSVGDVACI